MVLGGMSVKIRDIMSDAVVRIHPEETVEVAARMLEHYNVGSLPVCRGSELCGIVTDRDLVIRCMALGRAPGQTRVGEVMTSSLVCVTPDMDTGAAAHLMGRRQVRRLPVVEGGKLCGMVALADLSRREEIVPDAADALAEISSNVKNVYG